MRNRLVATARLSAAIDIRANGAATEGTEADPRSHRRAATEPVHAGNGGSSGG